MCTLSAVVLVLWLWPVWQTRNLSVQIPKERDVLIEVGDIQGIRRTAFSGLKRHRKPNTLRERQAPSDGDAATAILRGAFQLQDGPQETITSLEHPHAERLSILTHLTRRPCEVAVVVGYSLGGEALGLRTVLGTLGTRLAAKRKGGFLSKRMRPLAVRI